jgi:hypothetical protein
MIKVKLPLHSLLLLCCFAAPGVLWAADESTTLSNTPATTAVQPTDPALQGKRDLNQLQQKRFQHRQDRSAKFQHKQAQHAKQHALKKHHKKITTDKQALLGKEQPAQPITPATNS